MHLYKFIPFLLLLCLLPKIGRANNYQFQGSHYIANYLDCDQLAIKNIDALRKSFLSAVQAAKATIVGYSDHTFTPDGFSMVILLSESHASIHTYPEYNSCFIDFFSCGNSCDVQIFDRIMQNLLKPKSVKNYFLIRGEEIQPCSFIKMES